MTSSHVTNLGWWLLRFLLSSALSSSLSISILNTRRLVRVVRVLASARRMHSVLCSKMECRELNRSFPVVLRYSYHTALTVRIGDDVVDNGKYFCWIQRLCVLELCELLMPMSNHRLLSVEADERKPTSSASVAVFHFE